jgi:hypothetical protein
MSFQIDGFRSAVDTRTGARLAVKGTPEIQYQKALLIHSGLRLQIYLEIKPRVSTAAVSNSKLNPSLMILPGDLNRFFRKAEMTDIEQNTKLVDLAIRMIAFVNKHYPLSTSPYLWSDYQDFISGRQALIGTFLYTMPSDKQLLSISIDPDARLT